MTTRRSVSRRKGVFRAACPYKTDIGVFMAMFVCIASIVYLTIGVFPYVPAGQGGAEIFELDLSLIFTILMFLIQLFFSGLSYLFLNRAYMMRCSFQPVISTTCCIVVCVPLIYVMTINIDSIDGFLEAL